ncbi:MAG TPA: hypothetical protein VGQ63_15980 [Pseudolabrys sp.]|jgi:hypothetical protein|nr:hypothetical protein [Pseudolabrys sp.]
MTFKNKIIAALLGTALVTAFGVIPDASAAKKISYEEAYKRCKAFLDKEGSPGTGTQANVRYTRGSACMKKFGHKL